MERSYLEVVCLTVSHSGKGCFLHAPSVTFVEASRGLLLGADRFPIWTFTAQFLEGYNSALNVCSIILFTLNKVNKKCDYEEAVL